MLFNFMIILSLSETINLGERGLSSMTLRLTLTRPHTPVHLSQDSGDCAQEFLESTYELLHKVYLSERRREKCLLSSEKFFCSLDHTLS